MGWHGAQSCDLSIPLKSIVPTQVPRNTAARSRTPERGPKPAKQWDIFVIGPANSLNLSYREWNNSVSTGPQQTRFRLREGN